MLRLRGERLQVEVQAAQQGDLEMGLISVVVAEELAWAWPPLGPPSPELVLVLAGGALPKRVAVAPCGGPRVGRVLGLAWARQPATPMLWACAKEA